jgi:hypothetical protein
VSTTASSPGRNSAAARTGARAAAEPSEAMRTVIRAALDGTAPAPLMGWVGGEAGACRTGVDHRPEGTSRGRTLGRAPYAKRPAASAMRGGCRVNPSRCQARCAVGDERPIRRSTAPSSHSEPLLRADEHGASHVQTDRGPHRFTRQPRADAGAAGPPFTRRQTPGPRPIRCDLSACRDCRSAEGATRCEPRMSGQARGSRSAVLRTQRAGSSR